MNSAIREWRLALQVGFRSGYARAALSLLLLLLVMAWADSWEGLREASRRITSVEARFVQKKTLPILAKPFVSEGRFFYQAPGSLRWEYDRPVRSVLMMHGGTVKRYLREPEGWREEAGAVAARRCRWSWRRSSNWQQGRFDANPHFQASLSTGPEPRVIARPGKPPGSKMIRRIELTLSREQAGVMKSVRMVEDERSFTDPRIQPGPAQPAPAGFPVRERGMNDYGCAKSPDAALRFIPRCGGVGRVTPHCLGTRAPCLRTFCGAVPFGGCADELVRKAPLPLLRLAGFACCSWGCAGLAPLNPLDPARKPPCWRSAGALF